MSLDESQPISEDSAAAPATEPTVGERLRAAREAQPLSLAQISAELRIESKFLTALEEDRLDAFPAPVFAKGFLKQYGGMLGLDERDLLAQYYRQADAREVPVVHHKPIRVRDEDQIRHWLLAGAALILLGVGAVVWWTVQPEAEPLTVERTAEPAPALSLQGAPAAEPAAGAAAGDTIAEVPAAAGEDAIAEAPAVVEAPLEEPSVPEALTEASGVLVELSFVEDCWTEISDARGERLFYGLGSAGARSRFGATLPISVFLGNAGGIELTINGEPYPVPEGARQGNLARFVIADPGA